MQTNPPVNNQRIARNTLMLYFRMLLVMGITLYTSRVVLAQLGVGDYGVYNVVGGIVVMFSFLNGAMSQSTQRFFAYEIGRGNLAELSKAFKTALTIHLIIASIIFVLAETIGLWFLNNVMTIPIDKMIAANWVFQCSIIAYIVSIIQVPYNAAIISREYMHFYAYMGIFEVFAKLGIAYSLALCSVGKLQLYSFLVLLVTVIIFIIYKQFCRNLFKECVFGWLYEKDKFKEMATYAGWSTLGSLAWVGKSQGLNILLNIFFGPIINAAYGVANQVNAAVNSFVQNFSTAVSPQIVKSYSSGNYGHMSQLITYGAKFSFLLLLLLSFPILLTINEILNLWLVEVPEYTPIFTRLVIVNSLIESISYSMGTGIQATGRIKWYQILVGGTILCNIPVSLILLKLGYAPYIVFCVSIMLSLITISERLVLMRMNIPGFSIRRFFCVVLLPLSVLFIICMGLFYVSIKYDCMAIVGFVPTLVISVLLIASLEWLIGLNKVERKKICDSIKSKLLKRQS